MNTSEFFSKFKSRYLWGNIAAMVAVVFAVCLGVKFGLDIYTHHGEVVQIPNVRHKAFSDAEYLLKQSGLQVVVSDTGYVPGMRPDCILEQSPAPGEREVGTRDLPHRKRFAHAYALCARHHRQLIAARGYGKVAGYGIQVDASYVCRGRERLGVRTRGARTPGQGWRPYRH